MFKYKECYLLVAPFYIIFSIFVIAPIAIAIFFGFTDFNMLEPPEFIGLSNYLTLFFEDDVFLVAVRNTLIFAVITGPVSYFSCLLFAWLINELPRGLRSVMTFVFYAPSMSGMLYVIWAYIFSGDMYGLLNQILMSFGFVKDPVQWLTNTETMLGCIIIVQIWMSLGTSFLAFIAGLQNVDRSLYEAGAVDGIRNRIQELVYITLPSMGPQLLFSAVMQISAAFSVSSVCMTLAGFPSTDNAALTVATHAYDFGMIRFEMGYACAVTTVLFIAMMAVNKWIQKIISKYADV
ncbi:MAG: sugar ABC transporter permease [Clostridia bacterium]|nr:sugar ABC transporter permease [Clostridia bacterium]